MEKFILSARIPSLALIFLFDISKILDALRLFYVQIFKAILFFLV